MSNGTILFASKNQDALRILYQQADITVLETTLSDGVKRNIGACHVAIIDIDDIQPGDTSIDALREILRQSATPQVTVDEFTANVDRHLETVRVAAKSGDAKRGYAPRTVAIVSTNGSGGGVGKTTLTLHAARRFRQKTGLPVLVGEFCFGASGLMALTEEETAPSLYDMTSASDIAPQAWQDVSLAPLDYAMGRLRPRSDYETWYRAQKEKYTLVLLDVAYPNELLPEEIIDQWIIVARPERRDTIFSALRLHEMLTSKNKRAVIVTNGYRRGDGLALNGIERAEDIPYATRAGTIDGTLGKHILNVIYSGWSATMEKQSFSLWRRG